MSTNKQRALVFCVALMAFAAALWFSLLTDDVVPVMLHPPVRRDVPRKAPRTSPFSTADFSHVSNFSYNVTPYVHKRSCNGLAAAPRPPCTLPLLKSVFLENNYFPDCLGWTAKMTFRPEFCDLPAAPASLARCLTGRGIRRVALLGDSNINRVTEAFVAALGVKCHVIKKEKRPSSPDVGYYTNDRRGHVTHARHCTNCLSKMYRCGTGSESLVVEYVSMEYIWDTEITTFRVNPPKHVYCKAGYQHDRPCPQAHSTQQFIYKQYFTQTGYPDLILHFLSNHDKDTHFPPEVLMGAETIGRLIELYVPPGSRVVFFGKMYEELQYKPARWRHVIYEGRYEVPQQIRRLNKAAALGLRRAVAECPRIDVYFDLFTYGEGVAKQWGMDGVHKKPIWYKTFVSNFAKVLCIN